MEILLRHSNDANLDPLARCAARLLVSVQDDRRFPDVLGDHIVSCMVLPGRAFLPMYRRIIAPLLHHFWKLAIDRTPFQFRAPQLAAESLTEALGAPPYRRCQAILREVSDALGLRLPAWVAAWFQATATA